jgi:hypothetical protein
LLFQLEAGGALEGADQQLDEVGFIFHDKNFFGLVHAHDREF